MNLVDEYLRFTAPRCVQMQCSLKPNDLQVFFSVIAKAPGQVNVDDVLGLIQQQRAPRRGDNVIRLADGEVGLVASTIKPEFAQRA